MITKMTKYNVLIIIGTCHAYQSRLKIISNTLLKTLVDFDVRIYSDTI